VDRPLNTALGWRLPSWLLDFGPVVLIFLEGAIAIGVRPQGINGSTAVLSVALVVCAGALLFRHRAPLLVLAVVLATAVATDEGRIVILPVLLAVFTVAEYRDRTTVAWAAVITAAVLVGVPPVHGRYEAVGSVVSRVVSVGLAVAVGLYLRTRADYVNGLQERAERLERERELLAGQAVGEERLRIARELHDVVAHNVSLMVVQAQALAATSGQGPQAALGRIASLGREAMSEMHRMLGVLRLQEAATAEREPQPGVRDLGRLIDRAREAGLDATLTIQGAPRELPTGVDLSAYRIVQEALTNVIRHADAERANVRLRYDQDSVYVTITDDGVGPTAHNGSGGGHGLVGMRERVALFGGRLDTGTAEDGHGYRVHAFIPTG
jgi:signal transduction histidine kinase